MIAKRATVMKQLGLNLSTKRTRKREFFDEMNQVVPWAALVALIEPHSPRAKTGRLVVLPQQEMLPALVVGWHWLLPSS